MTDRKKINTDLTQFEIDINAMQDDFNSEDHTPVVTALRTKYPPWRLYRLKPESPYMTAGSEGIIFGYFENGKIGFRVIHPEVNPTNVLPDGTIVTGEGKPIQKRQLDGICVHIDPQWLEALVDLQTKPKH